MAKVDSDPDWFPGKHSAEPRGPKRLLRGPKLGAVVAAAKRLKANGEEAQHFRFSTGQDSERERER